MPKITKRYVESLIPHTKKTLKFWDSEIKGFGVVVLPSGRKTYIIQYRNADRVSKRFKLGVHGNITAEQARMMAKQHFGNVSQGQDPATQKKDNFHLPTIADLAQDYLERHGKRKRPRSLKEDQKFLNSLILPNLGKKKVRNVTQREIETLHLSKSATPYHANRMLSLLSKMFSLAQSWGWRDDNPVKGIERFIEQKRERWLNQEELTRLWKVLNQYPFKLASFAIKLLLLTGARRGEVLNATWEQFDFKQGVWTKPSHLTKQKKQEHLPLSEEAIALLQELKNLNLTKSDYLFPGRVEGRPMRDFRGFWRKVLKEANLENVRVHDLRHTYASHLVSNGVNISVVGKLLGHTQAVTTQRYAHLADESLRQATNWFGNTIKKVENENTKKSAVA